MTSTADDLVAVLAAQVREYAGLLPILEEEERVLVRADARALAEITEQRAAMVTRLLRLERDRGRALRGVAAALGVDAPLLTASRLIELLPASAPAFAAVRDQVRGLLPRLAERNGRNQFLAERTLTWLTGLFATLAPVVGAAPAPAYAPTGRSSPATQDLRLLDRRA